MWGGAWGLWGWRQAGRILEAELLSDDEHLVFVALYFVEADLVDLVGGEIGGGASRTLIGVVGVAVRERPDSGFGAALGNVGPSRGSGRNAYRRGGPASRWRRGGLCGFWPARRQR